MLFSPNIENKNKDLCFLFRNRWIKEKSNSILKIFYYKKKNREYNIIIYSGWLEMVIFTF